MKKKIVSREVLALLACFLLMLAGCIPQGSAADDLDSVRKAADQGDPIAQFALAEKYRKGAGVVLDCKQAINWYTKVAEQGLAPVQLFLGMLYEGDDRCITQDFDQVVFWYTEAAEQGNPIAQQKLGNMYSNSQGVPQDFKEAAAWYAKAANQGEAFAQNRLGYMYAKGQGVDQNDERSAYWYAKADDTRKKQADTIHFIIGHANNSPGITFPADNADPFNNDREFMLMLSNNLKDQGFMTSEGWSE